MKPTKQIIEKVTDEYMCLPRKMSVTEQLDWIKDACSRVAEAAREEERRTIGNILLGYSSGGDIVLSYDRLQTIISNNKDQLPESLSPRQLWSCPACGVRYYAHRYSLGDEIVFIYRQLNNVPDWGG